ncbi:DHA2 family efflux MFS transporter permease subunit [Nocardioides sp. TRM66260-LWL]|uniref:DHA2 family efflux MFS transporter permease subunit n=1 Tax=Nocardioides sp. TRM66260-LWL TaxID=2874478 RepID=UPI001CC6390E|nr:DHA2 family efflux MFS transporter permease subunit [Nocardioides sp. TRM66260-LWL]MBZ5735683.1 DHA2 family efflux MFS transporter permease subunit [Nocardioides sp. TRM66260-LWL]
MTSDVTSQPTAPPSSAPGAAARDPWPALFALCLGFFMILVDSTIVSVATPAIIEDLGADVNSVIWVTSAYLLAYAVPVLITGRLGDRFGPKRLYLAGLTVFTLASLWCGLTSTVEGLIVARVVQGLGASMITPQTMAIITRIFPAERRGKAMALWGATAGVATLVGPILGGVLVDALGWEWIFFINVPVGVIGFVLAWRLVPTLETHQRRFDWLGVVLSGAGMFLIVFGIQEGQRESWAAWIWAMIGAGLLVFALFVAWQARTRSEPLVPLGLFRDRNFSLANVAITSMGFAITALAFPLMLWAQAVRGLSPTRAALLLVPMAVMSIVLARFVGGLTDRVHPRLITGFGFAAGIVSIVWLAAEMTPRDSLWLLVPPMVLLGIGNAFIWAPNSATATRNLPVQQAGAGAGVYNATRQVGAVLGSAAIAALISARLAAQGLGGSFAGGEGAAGGRLPDVVASPFSTAMSQAMLLPAAVLVAGLVAAVLFERPRHAGFGG